MPHKAIVYYTYYNAWESVKGYVLLIIKPKSIDLYAPKKSQCKTIKPEKWRTTLGYARSIVKSEETVTQHVLNRYTRTMGDYEIPKNVSLEVAQRTLKRYGFNPNHFEILDCL